MENVKFQQSLNEQGQITEIEIGGNLVLEHAQQLKIKLVEAVVNLGESVRIILAEGSEIDLSCIQIIVAFIKRMDELDVVYHFIWNLDEDQKSLLKHVGLSSELFMHN
jgi:hypothetical protein